MINYTPTHITKTDPGHTVRGVASLLRNGDNITPYYKQYPYTWNVGSSRIHYERGPQRLNMAGRKVNHWKVCEHERASTWSGEGVNYRYSSYNHELHTMETCAAYDVPVVRWSTFGLTGNFPVLPSPVVVDDLLSEVYADIAGRANDSLLLLEDLAGFFSGKSLWKGIRGVAGATQGVAKAISDAKKLGRAFGWKSSLYNMWLSSKEAVIQAIGLRLGYRFSFKTTLNDIVKAVDFGYGFGLYLQQMQTRNSHRVLRYSKTAQNYNTVTQHLSRQQTMSNLLTLAPSNGFKDWFYSPPDRPGSFNASLPTATVQRRAGYKAHAWAYASVHYPMEYLTMKHYLEGRFGLNKPLTTLWAIVPLSFVIDYLFNVQDALSYVDNKLNDYLVATCVQKVWTDHTVFRSNTLDIPEKVISFKRPNAPFMSSYIELPHIKTTVEDSMKYKRWPRSSDSISASLPPLIAADETNWITSIGTGLELLSQFRRR